MSITTKRAPWSDTEYLHLCDLVEDRFAPFRQHGLGPVFWRTVADEMNRTFGTNRTPGACQCIHSQLSTGVIPRPEPAFTSEQAADADLRALILDLRREVIARDENRANFQSLIFSELFEKNETRADA